MICRVVLSNTGGYGYSFWWKNPSSVWTKQRVMLMTYAFQPLPEKPFLLLLVMMPVLFLAPAQAQPWATPLGRACIDEWIAVTENRLNTYNGDDEHNARKPWSINQYGVLNGNARYGPTSTAAPDDFWRYNNDRYHYIWRYWHEPSGVWRREYLRQAGVPHVRPYVEQCIRAHGGVLSNTPPSTPPPAGAEGWTMAWPVDSQLTAFGGGGQAGFYQDPIRSGDAQPPPGRTGILYTHPTAQDAEPAVIRRTVTLGWGTPALVMGVAGNADPLGDWRLVVNVDGQRIGERAVDGSGWQDLRFDLSAFAGRTVTIAIEVHNSGWWYEYAFFDYIRVE